MRIVAWEGVVSGTCAYACEKTIPCRASRSRFGVRPSFDPKKPIASARTVSMVIKTILGEAAHAGKTDMHNKRIFSAALRRDIYPENF